jgi:hypothetical protein
VVTEPDTEGVGEPLPVAEDVAEEEPVDEPVALAVADVVVLPVDDDVDEEVPDDEGVDEDVAVAEALGYRADWHSTLVLAPVARFPVALSTAV